MPRPNKKVVFSLRALWTITALACTSQAALVIITVTLATWNVSGDRGIYSIALAASFSDILTLPAAITIALLRQRHAARLTRLILGIGSISLALSAAVLTMYTLARIRNSTDIELQGSDVRMNRALTESGFAIWTVAIASQIILYTLGLWPENPSCTSSPPEESAAGESPSRVATRSTSAQASQLPTMPSPPDFVSESEPLSSAFSAYSTSPRSSFRNSVSRVIRPVTSRTRLLFQHPFILPDPSTVVPVRAASVVAIERNFNVRSWDAPVFGTMGKSQLCRKISQRPLETIRSSRPSSTANPLNGPFSGHADYPIRFTVTPPSSESSSVMTVIRSNSMSGNETEQDYIHPLFRGESATPPPMVSPGTVIVASPYAGQVVNPEHRSMTRWCSVERKRPEISSPFFTSISEHKAMI